MTRINDPTNLRKDLFVQKNNEWLITNSNGYFPNDRLYLSKFKIRSIMIVNLRCLLPYIAIFSSNIIFLITNNKFNSLTFEI